MQLRNPALTGRQSVVSVDNVGSPLLGVAIVFDRVGPVQPDEPDLVSDSIAWPTAKRPLE